MKKLRTAVVGVGHLGRFHSQKYAQIENSEFVGVSDLDSQRGQDVASELGVEYFSNYQDLKGKVDAVTVAASTQAHFELCKFFLDHGIHVHVEKPMTVNSEEGRKLCALAKEKNLKLQVGHIERFNPALISAREKLKTPLFIECHRIAPFKPRSTDVSVVLDLMIHDLDVVLSLVKSKPINVSAVGSPVLTKVADIANARIEFESGTVVNMTSSRVSQKTERKFRVFQANQYLSIDFGTNEVNLLTKTGEWSNDEIPLDHDSWNLDKGDALLDETQAFIDAILDDTPCIVSGEDGLVALELAEQVMNEIDLRLKKVQV